MARNTGSILNIVRSFHSTLPRAPPHTDDCRRHKLHDIEQHQTPMGWRTNAGSLIEIHYVKYSDINVRVHKVNPQVIIRTPTHMMKKLSTASIMEHIPAARMKNEQ